MSDHTERVAGALANVLSNAMNYPDPTAMLGKDTAQLRDKVVAAVMPLLADAWAEGAASMESAMGRILADEYPEPPNSPYLEATE